MKVCRNIRGLSLKVKPRANRLSLKIGHSQSGWIKLKCTLYARDVESSRQSRSSKLCASPRVSKGDILDVDCIALANAQACAFC